jgi:hypothetical protein
MCNKRFSYNHGTHPNLCWIALLLTTCLFLLWFALSMFFALVQIKIPFLLPSTGPSKPTDVAMIMRLMIFIGLLFYGAFYIFRNVYRRWCEVVFGDESLTLRKPLQRVNVTVEWKNVVGYSESQICVYRNMFRRKSWCCNSIVIYTKDNGVFEIVSRYCWNFEIVQESLESKGVKHFGFEPFYQTYFLGIRKYKFLNLQK